MIDGESGEVLNCDRIPIRSKDFEGKEELKILHIATTIVAICKEYNVTHIAIEDSFIGSKGGVGKTLARLYGGIVTLLLANDFKLIYSYTPSQWRKITCGYGKSKEGSAKYIQEHIIDLGEYNDKNNKDKNSDMYDSVGIAYCLFKKINNLK